MKITCASRAKNHSGHPNWFSKTLHKLMLSSCECDISIVMSCSTTRFTSSEAVRSSLNTTSSISGQNTRCNPSTSSLRKLFECSIAMDSIGMANMMQQRTEYVVIVNGRDDSVSSSHGLIFWVSSFFLFFSSFNSKYRVIILRKIRTWCDQEFYTYFNEFNRTTSSSWFNKLRTTFNPENALEIFYR